MFRELPRAGMKVTLKDFSEGLKSIWKGNKPTCIFEDSFERWFGVKYAFGVSSGRAALYMILKVLREKSEKSEVIIPAYICPTIPLAIARAGLKVRVCDISKDTFDFDHDQLINMINNNTLCILVAHLAGFPCDLDKLCELTANKDTLIIEDCAQAMGAEYKGKKIGQFGSFGFFSLGRGKGLTTYKGGLITTNNEDYAEAIKSKLSDLGAYGNYANILNIFEILGYIIFFHPFS